MSNDMTESEWLVSTDLARMLAHLRDKANNRSLRLFACAGVREVWHLLPDGSKAAVEVAERFADGLVTADGLNAANVNALALVGDEGDSVELAVWAAWATTWASAWNAAWNVAMESRFWDVSRAEQSAVLRSIMGNPFCTHSWDPYWSTGSPLPIAEFIYLEKAWSDLPILADALEDAGCTRQDVLDHLRLPGPHHRGDWALDLVLGKA